MARERSISAASIDYYKAEESGQYVSESELQNIGVVNDQGLPTNRSIHPISTAQNDLRLGQRQHKQSRRLPFWLWYIIAKSLGIKLHQNEKPIIATILYIVTFTSSLSFILTTAWYSAYDMLSNYTKTTVIEGCAGILFTTLWSAFGIYANKLAYRLFIHKKFSDMLRLHSKTILKINAAVMMLILMVIMVIVNDTTSVIIYYDQTCHTVGVEVVVCKIRYVSRVIYSIFALLWNYLVAFAVISACRTHTIGIRKFMKVLDDDSKYFEEKMKQENNCKNSPTSRDDEDNSSSDEFEHAVDLDFIDHTSEYNPQNGVFNDAETASISHLSDVQSTSSSRPILQFQDEQSNSMNEINSTSDAGLPPSEQEVGDSTKNLRVNLVSPMSNSQILHHFWKIQCRLRVTSNALQRWMMSLVCLVVVWAAMNLVMWLNYDPNLLDLSNFFLPLLILPLLSSAYAEVNIEGNRLINFIYPAEHRLKMIYILQQNPLGLSVFGFKLSYSTISTAAFGILLAFASKILIQEIG